MLRRRKKNKTVCILLSCILLMLTGCSNTNPSHSTSFATTKPVKKIVLKRSHPQSLASSKPAVVSLARLWGASREQVGRALRRNRLTERNYVPQDDPDPMEAGGEIRAYRMGGETEIVVTFNSQGYATIVSVGNESGLGLTLGQWRDAFRKYGLPECGEPAKTAPEAYYWGPPHNRTGGFEIEVIANEKGQVWQVQARSPEEFFPG
jgi:hypothetical protein